ncbi:hypothetical protein [Kribbella caucasensis]|nr:hypothetical protein [Kribbella sp. VKM Ac-2527]
MKSLVLRTRGARWAAVGWRLVEGCGLMGMAGMGWRLVEGCGPVGVGGR